MLLLITIALTIAIPAVMLVIHLTRWKFAPLWILSVVGMLVIWPLMLLEHQQLPHFLSGISWSPKNLLPISPILLADEVSWSFAMAQVTLGLAMVLTAVVRVEPSKPTGIGQQPAEEQEESARISSTNWRIWAGSLIMIGMGLVAVLSGNLLTILLAWAAIDIAELLVLMAHIQDSQGRERIAISFSTRTAGIALLIFAEIHIWRAGGVLSISSVLPGTAIYLLLAAGLRLGVVPLHIPFHQEIPLRRSLGTILRFVSTAASLSILVRAASIGLDDQYAPYFLAFSAIAAVFGAGMWMLTSDELSGRPYWILSTAALATAAAIRAQPEASLVWGVVSLYAGGLLFFSTLRHRRLVILLMVGFIGLSALPFTPTWRGASLYTSGGTGLAMPLWVVIVFNTCFFFAHSMLLAGYLRHSFRQSAIPGELTRDPSVERWIWLIYPIGLASLPITHFLTSFWIKVEVIQPTIIDYLGGLAATIVGLVTWRLILHGKHQDSLVHLQMAASQTTATLSLSWLYRPVWFMYTGLLRISSLTRSILEGDGGILWAIVLFFLILTIIK